MPSSTARWIGVAVCTALLGACAAQLRSGTDGDGGGAGDGAASDVNATDRGGRPDLAVQDGDGTPDGVPVDLAIQDAAKDSALDGAVVVGNPGLFTQPVFEMDFSRGTDGQYRGEGGAWQDFAPWNTAGSNGSWSNGEVYVQTTSAVRTELVTNATGPGRALRTWIEAGDQWKSGAAYPRTELLSSYTGQIPFGSEWRLELPFYVTGDVTASGSSVIGFQLHHNGSAGSPPFGLLLENGTLVFGIEEGPNGPWNRTTLLPAQVNTRYEVVAELKFGRVSDGAYFKLWVNGQPYVDVSNRNVGYPDLESTAGYWKFCSLYDWSNGVQGARSVHTPTFKLRRRP